ncbi:MAG TPA: ribosome maturation factor RimP [Polyangia bacterium]|nr:ribosome maturation factor RimP [Polyangia bacterium]
MRKDIENLWNLVQPYVNDAGFDLVEVQSGREPSGWVVRLFIDNKVDNKVETGAATSDAEGSGVSHQDCERVSRDVSAALDVADLIPSAYELEVSSPGLDRPLRRQQDFQRFAGCEARIRLTEGVEGRRNFSGRLGDSSETKDGFVAIVCDGRTYHLPIGDIAKANLVPDWAKEFKRSAS